MTLRTAQVQPAMDLSEVDDIPFDFTDDIVTGETITDAAITCEVMSGTDAAAQDMVTGSYLVGTITSGVFTAGASGKVVLQRFTAQQRDVSYAIRCVVTLSSGRKLVAAGELPVVKLASPA
jgi:hypothetical protein